MRTSELFIYFDHMERKQAELLPLSDFNALGEQSKQRPKVLFPDVYRRLQIESLGQRGLPTEMFNGMDDDELDDTYTSIICMERVGEKRKQKQKTTEPTREQKIAELCESNAYSESFFKDMADYRVDAYYNFHRKVQGFVPTMSKPVTMEFEKENNVHESEQDYDAVDRPKHYASTSIECIDAMIETQGEEAVIDFCVCNAFKYLWRHNSKNGDEDVRKANWYLNKAVELMDKYKKPIEF